MHFKEIIGRITGLSCPVFGVSWKPSEPEVAIARRVVTYLEDRRVLYVASEMEVPPHCVQSVLEIRRYLTEELQLLSLSTKMAGSLRAMRAACRKFLTAVEVRPDIVENGARRGHWASWEFNGALGELRGVFGIHICKLATSYGLDVEDDLAKILPADPVDDNTENTGD